MYKNNSALTFHLDRGILTGRYSGLSAAVLILLHSDRPKLCGVLTFLSAIGLTEISAKITLRLFISVQFFSPQRMNCDFSHRTDHYRLCRELLSIFEKKVYLLQIKPKYLLCPRALNRLSEEIL